jgi:hypothetical protein
MKNYRRKNTGTVRAVQWTGRNRREVKLFLKGTGYFVSNSGRKPHIAVQREMSEYASVIAGKGQWVVIENGVIDSKFDVNFRNDYEEAPE